MTKKIICCIVAICFAALLGFSIFIPVVITGVLDSNYDFKIVIDAGHGYPDGGALGIVTGAKESDINLSIAQVLAKLCKKYRIEPILTRNSKDALVPKGKNFKKRDMEKRREIINKAAPDLIISIHLNTFSDRSRKGGQVFYDKNSEKGRQLAGYVQSSLNELNEKKYIPLTGNYFMLKSTNFTAIIAECGFLTNPDEEKKLQTAEFQMQLAEKLLEGIIKFLIK